MTNKNNAIEWLKGEYLRKDGTSTLELLYIDYRDEYEDADTLQEVLKDGYQENDNWIWDSQNESMSEVISEYTKTLDETELDNETTDAMRDWLQDHDTSNPTKDLLKNTGSKLFFLETKDEFIPPENDEAIQDNDAVIKKYARNPEQEKEIRGTFNESFYSSMISFYFYADPSDIYNAIHKDTGAYINIEGAYCSTITRGNGSNWLGDNAIFNIAVPRDQFVKNFYADEAKGNGYSWREIAGQSGYQDAGVHTVDTIKDGYILMEIETSPAMIREQELQKKWDASGHKTCTYGDKNWNRHADKKEYRNEYPCGHTCALCGTFWID